MTQPTALPALAEVSDVRLWPGVIIEDDQVASVEFVLDAVSALVRLESGNPTRWSDGAVPASIRAVCVMATAKVLRNPDCASMMVTGPFSDQFVQGVEDALHLTDAMRQTIAQEVNGGRTAGLWTQSLTRGDDDPSLWPVIVDRFTGESIPRSPYPADDWLLGT